MSASATDAQAETVDRSALLLMLSYIEAECRRIGAVEAADHAALAASLVPEPGAATPGRQRCRRLH
jgi:hypothetical protein